MKNNLSLIAVVSLFASGFLGAQITLTTGTTTYDGSNDTSPNVATGWTISGSPTAGGGTVMSVVSGANLSNTFSTGNMVGVLVQNPGAGNSTSFQMSGGTMTFSDAGDATGVNALGISLGGSSSGSISGGVINLNETAGGTAYAIQRAGTGTLTISGGTINLTTAAGAGTYAFVNNTGGTTNISGGLFNLTNTGATGTNAGFNLTAGTFNFSGSSFTLNGTNYTTSQSSLALNAGINTLVTVLADGNTLTSNINYTAGTLNFTAVAAVPEPATNALIGFGFLSLAFLLKRKASKGAVNA